MIARRGLRAALAAAACSLALAGPALAQVTGEDPAGHEGEPGVVDHAGVHGGGHAEAGGPTEEHGEHGAQHGAHHAAEPPPPINWYQWHPGKDILGGELQAGEEPMPPGLLFGLLNFFVFIGLLVKFAGPKMATYLRTRHDTIKSQLEEAARLRQEARDKLEEYNQRIAGVDAEVNKLIGEIRAEADAEKQAILEQARAQAAAMKLDAERRIESEIARARTQLEREVVTAAIAAAEKILSERTTAEDQRRMFDGFLGTLAGGAPGGSPGPAAGGGKPNDEGWS